MSTQGFESVSIKAAIIAALTLLMLWPLARVQSLVSERQALQAQAYEVIAAGFGGAQVLGAPVLSVDTQERTVVLDPATKSSSETWARGASRHLLPDDVRIDTRTTVEVRSKGIYSVPVYVSKVVITGEFKAEAIAALLICGADTQALPAQAVFQLPVSGVKYLRNLTRFDIDGQPLRAASGEVAGFAALSTPMDLRPRNRSNPLMFRLEFEVAGSDSLRFLPLGSHTIVTADVAWPHPDFDGAFLPVSHELRAGGYTANWEVLELNRAIPQVWRGRALDKAALMGRELKSA